MEILEKQDLAASKMPVTYAGQVGSILPSHPNLTFFTYD